MSDVQNIKETYNLGNIVGLLKEKKLEIKEINDETYITGNLIIQVTNKYGISEIKVDVIQKQYYSNGKDNKQFKAFETVMNDYKDIKEYGEDADLVEVIVKVVENNYYNAEKDEMIETVGLMATTDFDRGIYSAIKRIKDKKTPQSSKIGFEGFISKIERQENNEINVEIIGVGYGGKAIKNKLVVGRELSTQFENSYQTNCQVTIYYVDIAEIEKQEQQESLGFGEGSDIVIEKINRKKLVVGATVPNYDGLKADQITQLLTNRAIELQEKKNKAKKEREEKENKPTFNNDLGVGFDVPTFNESDQGGEPVNPFGIN